MQSIMPYLGFFTSPQDNRGAGAVEGMPACMSAGGVLDSQILLLKRHTCQPTP
jgi:hypothetical protein